MQQPADAGTSPAANPRPHPLPGSPYELFIAFTLLALQGFGGVVAVVQRELVERKQWLTREEFVEDWAVAQVMPGPNVVNISLIIGHRHFGLRGAVAALCGMLLVPLLLLLAIAVVYARFNSLPAVAGALKGMGAVAIALVTATGFKLSTALRHNVMGAAACAVLGVATFIAIGILRLPLLVVLPTLGLAGFVLAYRKVRG